jgi:hypothetical protein
MIHILPNISGTFVDIWVIGCLGFGSMVCWFLLLDSESMVDDFRHWILIRWFDDFRRWILSRWFDDFRHWILIRWFDDFRRWILSRWFKCSDFHIVRYKGLCWPVQVH